MEGGTLVFGAHPSISPLVARVVDQYYLPSPAEELHQGSVIENQEAPWKNPSLVIYQSNVWKEYWAETTERLTRHPLVKVKWTEDVNGESVDPEVRDRPQAPKSMRKMRKSMLKETCPVAMIAIGGMKGVLDEAALFVEQRSGKPIYTFVTTGGAAALLPKQQFRNSVQVVDAEAEGLVRKFWEHQENSTKLERLGEHESREFYVPYAFYAQQLVARIIDNLGKASLRTE